MYDPHSLLQLVFDNLEDAIYLIDASGKTILANNAVLRLYKCSRKEFEELYTDAKDMLGRGVMDKSISLQVIEQKRPISACNEIFDIHGGSKFYHVSQYPIFDADGNVKYVLGCTRSQKQVQQAYFNTLGQFNRYNTRLMIGAPTPTLLYQSPIMKQIVRLLDGIASTDVTVLICGETGTGKDVFSTYIHNNSARAAKEMVAINCAAISASLFESELFGYEQGAFTGAASKGRPGLLEIADGSTLFLDEIDSIPLEQQGKLLRAIETKSFRRVGGTKTITSDFRLIAATNKDLPRLIREVKFREDLYYRLNIFSVSLPPLRERTMDIRLLAEHYLAYYCKKYSREKEFSEHVYEQFEAYAWPGNVRELKNVIERTVLASDMSITRINSVPLLNDATFPEKTEPAAQPSPGVGAVVQHSLDEMLADYEKQLIKNALNTYGTATEVARHFGVSLSTISRRMARYDLDKGKGV